MTQPDYSYAFEHRRVGRARQSISRVSIGLQLAGGLGLHPGGMSVLKLMEIVNLPFNRGRKKQPSTVCQTEDVTVTQVSSRLVGVLLGECLKWGLVLSVLC